MKLVVNKQEVETYLTANGFGRGNGLTRKSNFPKEYPCFISVAESLGGICGSYPYIKFTYLHKSDIERIRAGIGPEKKPSAALAALTSLAQSPPPGYQLQ